jgi:two-component sensor histidine kinase
MFESLFMDSRNQIWMIFIGNDHHWKLRKFDESHDSIVSEFSFPVANKLHEYLFVSDWWEDKKHRFWFGTTAGLFCFDEEHKQWHHYKNNLKDSTTLSGDMIFSLCPDPDQPDKYLWIGTNGHGLNRFDMQKGNCYRFDVSHSLPNQIIYGILSDNFHHIWLSTNNGLTCVDVKNFQVRSYNEKDGISGNEFNRYEYQKLQDGRLLFGGVKGYTLFDPQHVLEETIKTNTILTGFLVFNKQIDWKSHPAMITDPIQFARSITLPYNQNMFTIEFASLEYRDASKKYYTYYLDGFNEDWIANGTQHAATFTNLDPGTYTFYTAACDENGKHLSTSASIQIVILTPWWRSWWFISLTIFLIAFLIYSFYRYRLHQATRMLILRNRIASDLHDEIGSTISSISITSSLIQRKLKQTDPGVQSLLLRISQNTNEILEAMSDIVWAINASNDRFTHVFNRMRAFAVENLEPKHIHLDFEVDDTLNLLKLDIMERKNLYLLFKEAIHNIAKYADAKNVQVTIERNGHQKIKMRIADDGKGFDMDSMNEQTLGGNGLSNMQQRAAQLNGELHIESSPGHGTRITLLCPF